MATNTFTGNSASNFLGMSGKNAKPADPTFNEHIGRSNEAKAMEYAKKYATPSHANNAELQNGLTWRDNNVNVDQATRGTRDVPHWYSTREGPPVAYDGPSEWKERWQIKSAVREAANEEMQANAGRAHVVRTDPITDEEVTYVKHMKDQAELIKFDEYVEKFIDPRQPGNMKWLMDVYPDYVKRRLEQSHADYEFAMRKQMIESWGINSFDDLHFQFLIDQGRLKGPSLEQDRKRPRLNDTYAPGLFSPWNFNTKDPHMDALFMPFAQARHGHKPGQPTNWAVNRSVASKGTSYPELARGLYDVKNPTTNTNGRRQQQQDERGPTTNSTAMFAAQGDT
jgi:hypothetical protein